MSTLRCMTNTKVAALRMIGSGSDLAHAGTYHTNTATALWRDGLVARKGSPTASKWYTMGTLWRYSLTDFGKKYLAILDT